MREKRVKVRENLAIIGYVERTKAIVDDVASASVTSVSRFSFFEKKIYIYKKSRDRLVSVVLPRLRHRLFVSTQEEKKKKKISGQAHAHTHKIYAHVHKLVIVILC